MDRSAMPAVNSEIIQKTNRSDNSSWTNIPIASSWPAASAAASGPKSRQSKPKQFLDILGTGKSFIRMTYERFEKLAPAEKFPGRDQRPLQRPRAGTNPGTRAGTGTLRTRRTQHGSLHLLCSLRTAEARSGSEDDRHPGGSPDPQRGGFPRHHRRMPRLHRRPGGSDDRRHPSPPGPETGYGYIQVSDDRTISKVKCFTEKPNLELAQTFLQCGEFLWNSGIFVWKVGDIIEAVRTYLPEHHALFSDIQPVLGTSEEAEAIARVFSECRSISIDYGVMEKANNVYVRRGEFGWSDVGTWGSLYQHARKDRYANAKPEKGCYTDEKHPQLHRLPPGRQSSRHQRPEGVHRGGYGGRAADLSAQRGTEYQEVHRRSEIQRRRQTYLRATALPLRRGIPEPPGFPKRQMPLAGLSIGKRSALLLDKENMTKYSISPMSSLYELYLRHPRISTDSRRIEPDSVFFALRGASFGRQPLRSRRLEKGAGIRRRGRSLAPEHPPRQGRPSDRRGRRAANLASPRPGTPPGVGAADPRQSRAATAKPPRRSWSAAYWPRSTKSMPPGAT